MNSSVKFLRALRPMVIILSILVGVILIFELSTAFSRLELLGILVVLVAIIVWIWWGSKRFIKVAEEGNKQKLTGNIFLMVIVTFIIGTALYQLFALSQARIINKPGYIIDPSLGY